MKWARHEQLERHERTHDILAAIFMMYHKGDFKALVALGVSLQVRVVKMLTADTNGHKEC